MRLDYVHDIQAAFRKTITAFSFPGTIVDLSTELSRVEEKLGFSPSLLLLALMLLDGETTFAVYSPDGKKQEQSVSRLTLSRATDAERADFIFFPDPSLDASLIIGRSREGSLSDPHLSATLIFKVTDLSRNGNLALAGPGIEGETTIRIGRAGEWLGARQQKNKEYPLGIDVILITDDGRLAAIPRTTKIIPRPEAL